MVGGSNPPTATNEQPLNYTTMKKKSIIAIALTALICLPCILIIDGHVDANGEEHIGWTNLIGTVWFAFLALGGFKKITPKWMRDELEAYMPDHD